MKTITTFLIFILSISAYAESYRVVRVIDGDTIDIEMNGNVERIRLLCVNTPESVHRDKKQNVLMGKIASDYTKKRLAGKSVELEFEGQKRGIYGRLRAYVHVDQKEFCLELVRNGLSPYYTNMVSAQTITINSKMQKGWLEKNNETYGVIRLLLKNTCTKNPDGANKNSPNR